MYDSMHMFSCPHNDMDNILGMQKRQVNHNHVYV